MTQHQQEQPTRKQQQQAQQQSKVVDESAPEPQTLAQPEPHTVGPGDA